MTVKHKCSRIVSNDGWYWCSCSRPATVQRDGKWYCWQHDPIRVEADKEKRRAADKAKMDRYTARWARRARDAKLAALVTPELPALLGRLANCTLPSEHGNAPDVRQCIKDRKAARTLAAHIREALALETNDA